jgi:hypothetical protein
MRIDESDERENARRPTHERCDPDSKITVDMVVESSKQLSDRNAIGHATARHLTQTGRPNKVHDGNNHGSSLELPEWNWVVPDSNPS